MLLKTRQQAVNRAWQRRCQAARELDELQQAANTQGSSSPGMAIALVLPFVGGVLVARLMPVKTRALKIGDTLVSSVKLASRLMPLLQQLKRTQARSANRRS